MQSHAQIEANAELDAAIAAAASNSERAQICYEAGWKLYHTDPTQMLLLCEQAVEYALKGEDRKALAYSLGYRGTAQIALRRFDDALPSITEAIELYRVLGLRREEGNMLSRLGVIHFSLGQPARSLEYLLGSLRLWEELGDRVNLAAALLNVAKVHSSLGDRERGRSYTLRAVALFEELGEKDDLAAAHLNLGAQYGADEMYSEAAEHFRAALELLEQEGSELDTLAQCHYNLGALCINTGEPREALEHYARALKLYEQLNDPKCVADIHAEIGLCHFHLGEHAEALALLSRALAESEPFGEPRRILHLYSALSELCEAMGDNAEALRYQREYTALLERENEVERRAAIAEMQMRYDLEREQREKEELRVKMLEAEHRAVRSQINPHFISNALASIQAFLTEGDRTSAYRYLSRFGKLIRATLENTRAAWISLQQEIEALELYLELESLRFGGRFGFTISVDRSIDPVGTQIPPMLLQPYAENAIRHGLLPARRTGKLRITVEPNGEEGLLCTVEDNGVGREESERRKALGGGLGSRGSLGMKLMEERCALLRESTGRAFEIAVCDLLNRYGKPAGTRVEIRLPLMRSSDTSW